jgi:cobalt-zinc-cadmium efflux system membrane fusion protein
MHERSFNKQSQTSAEEDGLRAARRPIGLWLALAILALVGAGLLAWRFWPRSQATTVTEPAMAAASAEKAIDQLELSAEALSRAGIETQEVGLQSLTQTLSATGRIVINEDTAARVGSPTEGRVTRVLVTVGDRVRTGQPLFYLHSHELLEAQADYTKAQTAVTRAEKTLAYAKAELERANRLLEAKAISLREQMQAAAEVNAATAELERVKAELRRAEEYLEHLGATPESADTAVIRAPIAGVVLKRLVSIGTVVNPADDLMVIANLSTLWVIAEVPESQAAFVRSGQGVEITVAAFPERRFPGRVVYLGESLSPETRTVQVRCLVQNPRGQLRPEMYATVQINTGQKQSVLAVPRDAVHEMQGGQVVFIALGKGKFEKRVVQTGRGQDNWIEITNGLEAGQRIVTRGGFFIKSEFLKGMVKEE